MTVTPPTALRALDFTFLLVTARTRNARLLLVFGDVLRAPRHCYRDLTVPIAVPRGQNHHVESWSEAESSLQRRRYRGFGGAGRGYRKGRPHRGQGLGTDRRA